MPKAKCLMCAREISAESEADARKCSTCGQKAHDGCVRLLQAGKASSARGWKCNTCSGKDSPGVETAPRVADYAHIAQLRVLEEMISDSIKKHITASFSDFKTDINAITNKITELGHKIYGLEKSKEAITGRVDDHQQEIFQLKGQVNDLQQSKLSLNIEIHGVPQSAGEILKDVVSDIAGVIGAPESVSEIRKIYRGRKVREKPAPIVLEFSSDTARDEWLDGRKCAEFKEYKLPVLFSESVTAEGSQNTSGKRKNAPHGAIKSHAVRIFEQLTFANRQLLYEAKKAAKECNFQFAWTRGGKIFVRRDKDRKSVPIRIRGMNDILTKVRQNRVRMNEANPQENNPDQNSHN
jgi:hypothetical protein